MYKLRACIAAALLMTGGSAMAADLVVVTAAGGNPMTKEQVAELFLGKSQSFTPIDQPETSSVYAEFYRKATGRDVAQVRATWARLTFSGKGQPPKQLPDSAAVKKALAADPHAVGYIEKSAVDSSVKVVLMLD
jgi:hypothetical protein